MLALPSDKGERLWCPGCGEEQERDDVPALIRAVVGNDDVERAAAVEVLCAPQSPAAYAAVIRDLWGVRRRWRTPYALISIPVLLAAVGLMFLGIECLREAWYSITDNFGSNVGVLGVLLITAGVFAVAGSLYARRRLQTREDWAAVTTRQAVEAWESPEAVGALAEAARDPALRTLAIEKLAELLPCADAASVGALDTGNLEALTELLSHESPSEWPVVLGAARVLGIAKYAPATDALRALAAGRGWPCGVPDDVKNAARAATEVPREESEEQRTSRGTGGPK